MSASGSDQEAFTAEELENSFPLDRGRRFNSESGRRLVSQVLAGMDGTERRQRARRASAEQRRVETVEALLANIVAAHFNKVDPDRFVAVSFRRPDYVASDLCRNSLAACRDYLRDRNMIEIVGGFQKHEDHDDRQLTKLTRLRASRPFRDIIEGAGLNRRSLTIASDHLIRIKKSEPGLGQMPEEIEASRELIEAVNLRLSRTDIGVPDDMLQVLRTSYLDDEGDDQDARARKRRYAGDFTAKSIYRAFTGNWSRGGRFYGGWWMSVPQKLRTLLTIDGEAVVELDYKTLHPLLLFSRTGLSLNIEPYGVPPWQGNDMRDLAKRTFNRLLNRMEADPKKRLRIRAGKGDRAILPGRTSFTTFRENLVYHLRDISQWFGTGEGVHLQYEDSQLALDVMTEMEAEAIPVLPIHDSFIVQAQHEERLLFAMQTAFLCRYNDIALIEVKRPSVDLSRHPTAP